MRTRVKICGITRIEDALAAARCGADAIGLVFYAPSPRAVDIVQAEAIVSALPAFVSAVGLFVNETRERINEVLAQVPLDLLQFHGEETPEQCGGYTRPWIKAVRMREGIDLAVLRQSYSGAASLLLDTYDPGVAGGTGKIFDWRRVPREIAHEVILAGGLDPDNIQSAVAQVRPYGVDVSGGVEVAKGIKDAAKIAAFIEGVEHGDKS